MIENSNEYTSSNMFRELNVAKAISNGALSRIHSKIYLTISFISNICWIDLVSWNQGIDSGAPPFNLCPLDKSLIGIIRTFREWEKKVTGRIAGKASYLS